MKTLNRFQVAAAKAYSNGEHSHIAELGHDDAMAKSADTGDALFLLIMRELDDDWPESPMDHQTALQRMNTAIEQVQGIIAVLPK
jgi:hypothetical protein